MVISHLTTTAPALGPPQSGHRHQIGGLPCVLMAVAGAMACWPVRFSAHRLRAINGQPVRRGRGRLRLPLRRPGPAALVVAASALAFLTFGLGVAVATAVAGATARALWRMRRRDRQRLSSIESMADAVHGLVAELRSGAHPVAAAESAARDAREPAASVLVAVATTARLGGDLPTALRRFAVDLPTLAPVLRPLVGAWSLAHRHGLPLADVLDAVGRDVTGRVRFAHRVRARMAGPRASGSVLAVLPLLGVFLGQTMGARPLHVLFCTSLGQVLLALGTTLVCVGLYWIARLTGRAVLS
jgi:tight adherence protein B